jgi:hypothetical protein
MPHARPLPRIRPAEPAYAPDAGGSAGRPAQRAAVAPRRVMPQSGRTFSACGPFCPWVASKSTFWFSSRDLQPELDIAVAGGVVIVVPAGAEVAESCRRVGEEVPDDHEDREADGALGLVPAEPPGEPEGTRRRLTSRSAAPRPPTARRTPIRFSANGSAEPGLTSAPAGLVHMAFVSNESRLGPRNLAWSTCAASWARPELT